MRAAGITLPILLLEGVFEAAELDEVEQQNLWLVVQSHAQLAMVPGEVWGGSALKYFLALEEGINLLPGFSPELQGVYLQHDADGRTRAYGYMLQV